MWGVMTKVFERRGLTRTALDRLSRAERRALADGVLAEAEALRVRNATFSRQLVQRLAGNAGEVALSEKPDGLGCFYGSYQSGSRRHRLDVLPPRALWTGDMNGEAADAVDWLVLLDGAEVARAAAIEALPPLGGVLAARE